MKRALRGRGSWENRPLLGMLSGLIPYAVLVLTAGLGGGDMKLMAAVGAISASWEVVLSTTMYALAVALVMAVVVMVRRGVVKQTLSRVFSAALLASHRVKPAFPKDSPTVAFAAAVGGGCRVGRGRADAGAPDAVEPFRAVRTDGRWRLAISQKSHQASCLWLNSNG